MSCQLHNFSLFTHAHNPEFWLLQLLLAEHPNLENYIIVRFYCSALLWLTDLVPNSGIPDSEVILYLTSQISKKKDYRYKAIGKPLAEASAR